MILLVRRQVFEELAGIRSVGRQTAAVADSRVLKEVRLAWYRRVRHHVTAIARPFDMLTGRSPVGLASIMGWSMG